MAAAKTSSMLVAMMMFVGLFVSVSAVTHTVNWHIAENATFYDEWASQKTFAVNDVIAFVFDSTAHNVFEVSKADLDSCNLNNPLQKYETSNASVNLTRSGYFGFICGVPNHCSTSENMKMNVQVLAATTPSPSPVSPPTASSPQSPPVSPPTGSSPSPSSPNDSPSTPPSSSSPPPTVRRLSPAPAPPPSDASSLQSRSAMVVGALVAGCAALLL